MSGLKYVAAIFVAGIVFFIQDYSYFSQEMIKNLAMLNTVTCVSGWGFFSNKIALINFKERVFLFLITNRILAAISIGVDVFMVVLGLEYGFWAMFLGGQIVFFLVCLTILKLYNFFLDNGIDLLSMDYFHDLKSRDDVENVGEKITQFILLREGLLFWIGSLWIEPDVVTLLLRKGDRTTFRDIIFTTLPGVLICISFWAVVFGLGIKGYTYFSWFID